MKTESLKILSIDDDSSCNLVAAKFFTLVGGHIVEVAENGIEGLKKAAQLHPDIILLDMNMPNMTGLQVMDALCQEADTRDIPVIMLTGAILDQEEMFSLKAKHNFMLLEQKPANFSKLLNAINAALHPGILSSERSEEFLGDVTEPA